MNMKKKYKYLLSISIPVLILLIMLVKPLLTLFAGQEILLQTAPIDPRDLFRGDHVVLNYQISRVSNEKFPDEIQQNIKMKSYSYLKKLMKKTLYVVLKPNNGYYEVDYVTLDKPKDKIFIKGKIANNWWAGSTVPIDYGLDKFFVPENTGMDLQRGARKGEAIATVKVLNGYPLLTKVELE